MLLALASGTALCAIVGFAVVRSADQARERAELAARREAHDVATALRARLHSPTVLAAVAEERQFTLVDGSVVIDDAVGWLHEGTRLPPDATVAERLRLAQCAEFVQRDVAAARAQLDDLLQALPAHELAALPVLVAAAWQAQRAGEHERTDTLLAHLHEVFATLPPRALAWVKSSDKRFAYDVLHPRMMEFLLAERPPALELEDGALCLGDGSADWRPETFRARFEFLRRFAALWPRHLLQDLET